MNDGTRRQVGRLLGVAIVAGAIVTTLWAWSLSYRHPRTDDAAIRANVVGIAPHVGGPIVALRVVDNQAVRAGDLLFTIDARPYEAKLAAARAAAASAALHIRAEYRGPRWLVYVCKPLTTSLLLALAAGPVRAGEADEASIQILRDTLRTNKKAFVAVNLALSDAEAQAFWPVYDRYQKDLGAVQERLLQVIEAYSANFGHMTDEEATKLVKDYLAVEEDRAEIRRAFEGPISKTLPGRKMMRFYQIENKIDAVLRYELAATIPVVEQ